MIASNLFRSVFICLAPSMVLAAPNAQAGYKPNGEYWRALTAQNRENLLYGIFLGLAIGAQHGDLSTDALSKLSLHMTADEMVATFDSFYVEPLNRTIPLDSAWIVVAAQPGGATESVVSKLIEDLRAATDGKAATLASQAPPTTKYPELYDIAQTVARRSAALAHWIGSDWIPSNERSNAWSLSPDQGAAYVFIDVRGTNGAGRLSGHAIRQKGRWIYDDLSVLIIDKGEIIDLLESESH